MGTTAEKLQKLVDNKQLIVDAVNARAKTSLDINSKPSDIANIIGLMSTQKPEQEKTVTPNKTELTVTPDNGYALSKVTVKAIPSDYIIPSGTKEITANGTHLIREYREVNVNVTLDETQYITAYYGEGV